MTVEDRCNEYTKYKSRDMNYLQKKMARYYKWRKGVLLIMPLEVLLIIVVLCLLIAAFVVSYTSTKGTLALAALRNHLSVLQPLFSHSSTVDAEAERNGLEKLLNNVKATCHQRVISRDVDLQSKLSRACEQISAITKSQAGDTKSSWIKLRAAAYGFGESYFPGFTK